ncbi:MAG: mevalonate kinase family protein [Flavobacteriaceae bacterium]
MIGPLFYAKILLFGEYGIIKDSKGLSIPYNFYRGALRFPEGHPTPEQQESHRHLMDFFNHLKSIGTELVAFDWKQMHTDIQAGMYFDSSIPQGYGVGSSGALVASVYDRYSRDKITVLENLTKPKLQQLKEIFARMEAFFHGKSSGLDPLNSYLSLPILIHSKDHIQTTGIPSQNTAGKGAVFLLDTKQTGETAPMVDIFLKNMRQEAFQHMIKHEFIQYTDACVDDFLNANFSNLFTNMRKLSDLVLKNFKPMIPKEFQGLWAKGLETDAYYLKLCGSGGGGFILGFTQDLQKAQAALPEHSLEVVYHI